LLDREQGKASLVGADDKESAGEFRPKELGIDKAAEADRTELREPAEGPEEDIRGYHRQS